MQCGLSKVINSYISTAPGPVESVVLFGDTVAITLAWNQPQVPNGVIWRYEIVYSDGASTNMVTATHGVRDCLDAYSFFRRRQTSKVLVGLKPDTTYNITITPRNTYLGVPTSVAGKTLYIRKHQFVLPTYIVHWHILVLQQPRFRVWR